MLKLILANFLISLTIVCIPTSTLSYNAPKTPIKPTINDLITHYATLYGVSQITLHKVIKCESGYNPKAIGDGGKSFGLVQIHSPSHPDISKKDAFDPDFAIDFLAKNVANGKGNLWTCYRKLL